MSSGTPQGWPGPALVSKLPNKAKEQVPDFRQSLYVTIGNFKHPPSEPFRSETTTVNVTRSNSCFLICVLNELEHFR